MLHKQEKTSAMLSVFFLLATIEIAISGCASSSNSMVRTQPSDDLPVLSAPVEGIWRVIDSPGHARFAYDLASINPKSGSTLSTSRLAHILGRASVEDSFSWGKPVRSPVSGTVIDAIDEVPDREALSLVGDLVRMVTSRPDQSADDIRPFAGNYIIIAAEGFYVFVAHLRSGSVRVEAGDEVKVGQVLGQVGNSGFTLEPHLHIQLLDSVDDLLAASTPPFKIDAFEVMKDGNWEAFLDSILPKGEIVRFD